MPEVTDPVCGMTFEEETALDLGATFVETGGRRVWFCCPTCEQAWREGRGKDGHA